MTDVELKCLMAAIIFASSKEIDTEAAIAASTWATVIYRQVKADNWEK